MALDGAFYSVLLLKHATMLNYYHMGYVVSVLGRWDLRNVMLTFQFATFNAIITWLSFIDASLVI